MTGTVIRISQPSIPDLPQIRNRRLDRDDGTGHECRPSRAATASIHFRMRSNPR